MKFVIVLSMLVFSFVAVEAAGTIVFLNGTSSAGKSSIRRVLPGFLEGPTQIVDFDRVAREILYNMVKERGYTPDSNLDLLTFIAICPESFLNKQDIIDLYPAAQKKAYDLIRRFFLDGSNVITETLVSGAYDTRICLEALHDLPVMFTFVYCSPKVLLNHVLDRNQSDDKDEHRGDILEPFILFSEVYKRAEDNDCCIDIICKNDIDTLFDRIAESIGTDDQNKEAYLRVNTVRNAFKKKFELDVQQEARIAPILEYDCIINTNSLSPQECAKQFVHDLCFLEPNALKKNYGKIKNIPILRDERSSQELVGLSIWQRAKSQNVNE